MRGASPNQSKTSAAVAALVRTSRAGHCWNGRVASPVLRAGRVLAVHASALSCLFVCFCCSVLSWAVFVSVDAPPCCLFLFSCRRFSFSRLGFFLPSSIFFFRYLFTTQAFIFIINFGTYLSCSVLCLPVLYLFCTALRAFMFKSWCPGVPRGASETWAAGARRCAHRCLVD